MVDEAVNRALWKCTVQGFMRIRSVARHGLPELEATEARISPGFVMAGPYIAEVSAVCWFIGSERANGATGLAALIRAQQRAGNLGRAWLINTVEEYASRTVAQALREAADDTPWSGSPSEDRQRRGGRSRSRWCKDMLTAGFARIHHLAAEGGGVPLTAQVLHEIGSVADTCHQVPYPEELPLLLRPWLIRRYLSDGWKVSSDLGRAWCREESASFGYRPPGAIRRILAP